MVGHDRASVRCLAWTDTSLIPRKPQSEVLAKRHPGIDGATLAQEFGQEPLGCCAGVVPLRGVAAYLVPAFAWTNAELCDPAVPDRAVRSLRPLEVDRPVAVHPLPHLAMIA